MYKHKDRHIKCLCVLGTVRTNLVGAERVRQHVAAARPQHVHLLAHIVLQLLKLALGAPDLGLDLSKGPDRPRGVKLKHTVGHKM